MPTLADQQSFRSGSRPLPTFMQAMPETIRTITKNI